MPTPLPGRSHGRLSSGHPPAYIRNDVMVDMGRASEYPNYQEHTLYEIGFINVTLNNYIYEWNKMLALYKNGTLDDEVYFLWIEKTISIANSYYPNGMPSYETSDADQLCLFDETPSITDESCKLSSPNDIAGFKIEPDTVASFRP